MYQKVQCSKLYYCSGLYCCTNYKFYYREENRSSELSENNMSALLVAGKYVEKKVGSFMYACFFHGAAIVDAVIVAFIFRSESVGASAGIFAAIGVFIILLKNKKISVKKAEIVFLIIFVVVSLPLGIESLITHLIALIMGIIFGALVIKNKKDR